MRQKQDNKELLQPWHENPLQMHEGFNECNNITQEREGEIHLIVGLSDTAVE